MILNYKTGKLPASFVITVAFFVIIGIWRLIILDWFGIILLIIGATLLLVKFGINIDTENKLIRNNTSIFNMPKGKWLDISTVQSLQIIKVKETQSMNVVSINRTESKIVYKLYMILHYKKIEIIKGDIDFIKEEANKISKGLNVSII
jgi:hypothetical protein